MHKQVFQDRFIIFSLFISAKGMDLEQTVKDLQAQNAQFQQMFLALAKGQDDLKAQIIKEKTKKAMKQAGVLNLGRSFRGSANRALDFATPSNEGCSGRNA